MVISALPSHTNTNTLLADDARVGVLEPLDGLLLGHTVVDAHTVGAVLASRDTATRTLKDDVEIHTIDTYLRIVLDAEIDVLLDTEAKVARAAEVAVKKLVLLNLKTLLEDLSSLRATNCGVNSDLLVTTDGEGTHGVASARVNGGLASKSLKHLSSTSKTITALTDADVHAELSDADLTHRVLDGLCNLLRVCHRRTIRLLYKKEKETNNTKKYKQKKDKRKLKKGKKKY